MLLGFEHDGRRFQVGKRFMLDIHYARIRWHAPHALFVVHQCSDILRLESRIRYHSAPILFWSCKKGVIYAPARGFVDLRLPLTFPYLDRHKDGLVNRARG